MPMMGPGQPPPKPEEMPLAPFREDLQLLTGTDLEGNFSRRIHDPSTGRYYQIDEPTWEILRQWNLKKAGLVAQAASLESGMEFSAQDVLSVQLFLQTNFLLEETGAGKKRFLTVAEKMKLSFSSLAQKYLYIKIPMLHPERLLDVLYPFARPFFSPVFWTLVLVMSVISLMLIARQWDVFIGTIPDFFRFDGMLVYGFVITLSKALHEMAHALTVRHYGMRVPTMGVVILVLFPLLYTDASESWRSTNPRVRLNIAAAGIIAELALASLASVGWLVLDEGPWKSACFVLATVNWVTTIFFNMNPLMRFDGYFILSDLLKIENLQQRAFAQLKHFLAWTFLRVNIPVEEFSARWRAFLVAFGTATFIYRISVIVSISLMVYYYFFKALGILLFVHQVYKSVAAPLKKAFLWSKKNKMQFRPTIWFWLLSASVAGGIALGFMPVSQRIGAQAQFVSVDRTLLHAAENGRVIKAPDTSVRFVKKDEVLYEIESPEVEQEKRIASMQIARLKAQLGFNSFDSEQRAERLVIIEELRRSQTRLANALEREKKLKVVAPQDGRIDWSEPPVRAGQWIGKSTELAVIGSARNMKVISYVTELDRRRISVGAKAWFYPRGFDTRRIALTVSSVSDYAVTELSDAGFASAYGGEIVVENAQSAKPLAAFYRLELLADEPLEAQLLEKAGRVEIQAQREAPVQWLWRKITGIAIRESVF